MMRRSRFVCRHLERAKSDLLELGASEISGFVRRQFGLYALYLDDDLYYVGLAADLQRRVSSPIRSRHQKSTKRLAALA